MIPNQVIITVPSNLNGNAIAAVKALRGLSGLALKEAKDIVFLPGEHRIRINVVQHYYGIDNAIPKEDTYRQLVQDLESYGFKVGTSRPDRQPDLDALGQMASAAVLRGDYEFSQRLIEVLKHFV